MKAIILDMFGVILKQTGEEFYSYVQQDFPALTQIGRASCRERV